MRVEADHASDESSSTYGCAQTPGYLDWAIVVAKHKAIIATTIFSTTCLGVIIALLLPNIYTGAAKILPPQQNQSTAAMLLGQLGGLANLAGSSLGIKNPSDLYVGMLKSRTVADNIIQRFELKKYYGEDTILETRKTLESNRTVTAGKDGLISIEFDDEDAKLAAAIANAHVEELSKLTQSLAITEAAQRRLFFENQLHQAKDELGKAETALRITQEKTGLIKLDDQGRAIIEAVAALRAQIAVKEVELSAMRAFATTGNPDYVRVQQQLAGLRAELVKLETAKVSGDGDILLPTGRVPEAGLEYVRKLRDVKYSEAMFELLAKQFEIAKIDEAKDAALIQIVDHAVAPDHKSRPKRLLLVLVAFVLGGLLGIAWAFTREFLESANQNNVVAEKLARLRQYLRFYRERTQ